MKVWATSKLIIFMENCIATVPRLLSELINRSILVIVVVNILVGIKL